MRSPEHRHAPHDFEGVDLPPVILPSDARRRGPRGSRWLVPLLVVVVGAGVALAIASPRTPDVSAGPPVRVELVDSGGPPPASAFARALDSLRVAIDRYRQRELDFERGRIDCAALSAGYGHVGRQVVEVAHARGASPEPGPEAIEAFESVMEVAAEVDRRFDASGCPRP